MWLIVEALTWGWTRLALHCTQQFTQLGLMWSASSTSTRPQEPRWARFRLRLRPCPVPPPLPEGKQVGPLNHRSAPFWRAESLLVCLQYGSVSIRAHPHWVITWMGRLQIEFCHWKCVCHICVSFPTKDQIFWQGVITPLVYFVGFVKHSLSRFSEKFETFPVFLFGESDYKSVLPLWNVLAEWLSVFTFWWFFKLLINTSILKINDQIPNILNYRIAFYLQCCRIICITKVVPAWGQEEEITEWSGRNEGCSWFCGLVASWVFFLSLFILVLLLYKTSHIETNPRSMWLLYLLQKLSRIEALRMEY